MEYMEPAAAEPAAGAPADAETQKINQSVAELETRVAATYASAEKGLSLLFSSFLAWSQPTLASTSELLDRLDERLEKVESGIVRLGQEGFKKVREAVVVEPGLAAEPGAEPGSAAPALLRSDALLHALHSDKTQYMQLPADPAYAAYQAAFSADAHTQEIAALLEQHPALQRTMNEIVPEHVSYAVFWGVYYFRRDEIRRQEEERRRLVASDDEEEVKWSDDEADTGAAEPAGRSSGEITYELESRGGSTLDVVGKVREKQDKEESDDDWE